MIRHHTANEDDNESSFVQPEKISATKLAVNGLIHGGLIYF